MQAFVTGGTGLVGSRLIEALQLRGYKVLALVRSEEGSEKVRSLGAEPIFGDLDAVELMHKGMAGCEVVFHAAASLFTGVSAAAVRQINVEGTHKVVEAARLAGVARLVYISAASVVVNGRPVLEVDETYPIPTNVVGPYSRTKAEAERIVLEANRPNFTTVAVRPPLIWGGLEDRTLSRLTEMAHQGQFIWFSGGRYPYVTCHVANVVEGAILAAEKGRGGEAYFLTDGPPLEFREIMSEMLRTQGVEPGKRSLPIWLANLMAAGLESIWWLTRRKGAPPLTREIVAMMGPLWVNDSKARRELGYQARFSRKQGLAGLVGAD